MFSWCCLWFCFFFVKQKTAYEMRISDWSSDVCSSDLPVNRRQDRFLEEPGKSRRPRSVDQPGGEARQRLAAVPELRQHDLPLLNGERAAAIAVVIGEGLTVDRKSTRLNSSH